MPKYPIDYVDVNIPDHLLDLISKPDDVIKAKKLAKRIEHIKNELKKAEKLRELLSDRDAANFLQSRNFQYVTDDKIIKYAQLISKNCKFALAACQRTNNLLYRGIKENKGNNLPHAFVSSPRTDRESKDTPNDIHAAFDKLMKKVGYIATRSNSIFCTSDRSDASHYGNSYIIFPLDGFHFTWSVHHRDLTSDLFKNSMSIDAVIGDVYGLYGVNGAIQDGIIELASSLTNDKSDSFPLALQDPTVRKEFMLLLDNFNQGLHENILLSTPFIEELQDALSELHTSNWMQGTRARLIDKLDIIYQAASILTNEIDAKEFMDRCGLITTGFDDAIRSRNEILISGRYYAFSYKYIDPLREILLGKNL